MRPWVKVDTDVMLKAGALVVAATVAWQLGVVRIPYTHQPEWSGHPRLTGHKPKVAAAWITRRFMPPGLGDQEYVRREATWTAGCAGAAYLVTYAGAGFTAAALLAYSVTWMLAMSPHAIQMPYDGAVLVLGAAIMVCYRRRWVWPMAFLIPVSVLFKESMALYAGFLFWRLTGNLRAWPAGVICVLGVACAKLGAAQLTGVLNSPMRQIPGWPKPLVATNAEFWSRRWVGHPALLGGGTVAAAVFTRDAVPYLALLAPMAWLAWQYGNLPEYRMWWEVLPAAAVCLAGQPRRSEDAMRPDRR